MIMAHILIIEDDVLLREALRRGLSIAGHLVKPVEDGVLGLEELVLGQPDLVLLDVRLKEDAFDGIELLGCIRELHPLLPVIIMTGYGTVETAVEAMKQGASDFIQKPFNIAEMEAVIERVLTVASLKREVDYLLESKSGWGGASDLVFADEVMAKVVDTARRVAVDRGIPVLICGERGTGKDALARLIHCQGQPHSRPLVAVNCAALNKMDADRFLWGAVGSEHMSGVVGKCELADGGTLLLDEIDTLDLRIQEQLVHFMEVKKIKRIGAQSARSVDVRIIAMSRCELAPLDNGGTIHPSLLFRLGKVGLFLPPLRDRNKADVERLFRSFLDDFFGVDDPPDVDAASIQILAEAVWSGNVRELRNLAERVWILFSKNKEVELAQWLGASLGGATNGETDIWSRLDGVASGQVFDVLIQELLQESLRRSNGRQAEACRWLGISKSRFSYRLRQYGINPRDYT
jgi:two-component system, NtrC family, response regulator AtoC